ncbi:hypothetical protein YA35_14250 [Klebsiella aerogenes]|nr:hypothetical protein YA35_14250 [Klebsiella aerogenes]
MFLGTVIVTGCCFFFCHIRTSWFKYAFIMSDVSSIQSNEFVILFGVDVYEENEKYYRRGKFLYIFNFMWLIGLVYGCQVIVWIFQGKLSRRFIIVKVRCLRGF